MFNTRIPANKVERNAWTHLRRQGFLVTRRGWPDFGCIGPDGQFIVVEVKPTYDSPLKEPQQAVMYELAARGVECYRYDGDFGMHRLSTDDLLPGRQAADRELLEMGNPYPQPKAGVYIPKGV